jgi:hypothetical protein
MRFGITLDTGALIALERGEKRMRVTMAEARSRGLIVRAPAVADMDDMQRLQTFFPSVRLFRATGA